MPCMMHFLNILHILFNPDFFVLKFLMWILGLIFPKWI